MHVVDMSNLGASHSIRQDIHRSIVLVCKKRTVFVFLLSSGSFFSKSHSSLFLSSSCDTSWYHKLGFMFKEFNWWGWAWRRTILFQTNWFNTTFQGIHISHLKKSPEKSSIQKCLLSKNGILAILPRQRNQRKDCIHSFSEAIFRFRPWRSVFTPLNRKKTLKSHVFFSISLSIYWIDSNNLPLPEKNIAREKWWFGRLLSYWEGNFSGTMLNFRGVYTNIEIIIYIKLEFDIFASIRTPQTKTQSKVESVGLKPITDPWDWYLRLHLP